MAVGGFAVLTLPFVINHLDRGEFYYQEVPIVPPIEIAPEAPTGLDMPVSPVDVGVGAMSGLGTTSGDVATPPSVSPDEASDPDVEVDSVPEAEPAPVD